MQNSNNRTNLEVGGALCNNYCRHKTNCAVLFPRTPSLLLRMRIPVRLVMPSLDAIGTFWMILEYLKSFTV